MRWICWASALLAAYGLVSPAAGAESSGGAGMKCAGCGHCQTYSAPACAAPFYGMAPGCCKCPPSACDNAWAGYCQEKARWKAFWYRVGTGGSRSRGVGPTLSGSGCAHCQAAVQPVPSAPSEPAKPAGPVKPSDFPPTPKPVPEQTTWKLPWFR